MSDIMSAGIKKLNHHALKIHGFIRRMKLDRMIEDCSEDGRQ